EPLPERGARDRAERRPVPEAGPVDPVLLEPVPLDPLPLDPTALEPEPLADDAVVPVAARAGGGVVVPPPVLVVPPTPNALPLPGAGRGPRATLPPGEEGEVIHFPRPRPPPVDALAHGRRRPPAPPPPLVRTSRVVAMIVAGLLAVLLGYAWIRVNAFSRAGVGTPDTPVARLTKKAEPAPVSPLVLLDAELRKSLSPTPRAVKKAGDLSDALLLELVQQRVQVVAADGLVTKWIGRLGDEPKTAEVRVRYRSGGDMSRELGAIALVVGRYKRFYHLEMPVFEVTEEGTGGVTTIDPDKAEAYYQARLTLEELLGSIAKK
ncbi:MAG: hypothetical protein ACK4YP_28035, partial [Myxococcota bacterium]